MVTFTSETAIAGSPGRETQEHEGHLSSWAITTKTGLQGLQAPLAAAQEVRFGGEKLPEARSLVGDRSLLWSLVF